MQTLQYYPRSDSYDQKPSDFGSAKSPATSLSPIKTLIQRANTIPLPIVVKHYGRLVNEQNQYIVCPFPKHSNGRENSGSFKYYPESNTFWCFGCKTGTTVTAFIAAMENIGISKAAQKALELFGSDVVTENETDAFESPHNYSERLAIMMTFSDYMREFIQAHCNDTEALTHIEQAAEFFDQMADKYTLDNTALQNLIAKLKEKFKT